MQTMDLNYNIFNTMYDCMLIVVIDSTKVAKHCNNYRTCCTYENLLVLLLSTFGFQLEYLYLYLKKSKVLILYLHRKYFDMSAG